MFAARALFVTGSVPYVLSLTHCIAPQIADNMDLVIKWHAQQRLDGRILGDARGRVKVCELSFSSDELELSVEGEWQYRRPMGGPLIESEQAKAEAEDSISDVERQLKRFVAESALEPIRRRLERLRSELSEIAERYQRGERSCPEPTPLNELPEFSVGPSKRAEESTAQIVRELKAQMRSENFEPRLTAMRAGAEAEANLRCMCLTDADMPAVVDALPDTPTALETIDLSYNDLTDTGIQQLICALATGAAPTLRTLKLGRTLLSEVGKRQLLQGLGVIRRELTIIVSN